MTYHMKLALWTVGLLLFTLLEFTTQVQIP